MKSQIRTTFRENLIALIHARPGETMEKVALETEISRSSLYRYLDGKRSPSLDVLERLARYFNLQVYQLLTPGYPGGKSGAPAVGEKAISRKSYSKYRFSSDKKIQKKRKKA